MGTELSVAVESTNSAVWGFVGVIAGGVIAAATAYFAEWRQRKRLGKVAKATALTEVEEALLAIQSSSQGKWTIGWNLIPWYQTWRMIQGPLADYLDRDSFNAVRKAYGSMFRLQQGLRSVGGKPTSSQDSQFFRNIGPQLEAAQQILNSRHHRWRSRLSGVPDPVRTGGHQ